MLERPGEGPLKPQWEDEPEPHPSWDNPEVIAPRPTPKPSTTPSPFRCLGVKAGKTMRLIGSTHDLPGDAKPSQPTTDADGLWVYGYCITCEAETVWRKSRDQR